MRATWRRFAGVAVASSFLIGHAATQEPPRWFTSNEEATLAELMEFWVRERGINLEFDPAQLQDTIQLRTPTGVTTDSLWALTNRLLAERSLACVQVAGEESLTVVPLDKASSLARLAPEPRTSQAGFIKVVRDVRHVPLSVLEDAVQAVLQGPGTAVTILSESNQIVFSGLKSQVIEALDLVERLDYRGDDVVIHEIPLVHVHPVGLQALLDRLNAARSNAGQALDGTLLANPASGSVLVVAPDLEIFAWEELVQRFDRPEDAYTIHYTPRRFGLRETAELVEQVLTDRVGQAPPRLVSDNLTGALIVSATASQHAQIEALLLRLDETEPADQQTLRAISVRNRDASELLTMLADLLADGPVRDSAAPAGQRIPLDQLSLSVDPGTNRILAMGEPRWLRQLDELVRTLDVQSPQVLVEAIVLGLTDTEARDLGVEIQSLLRSKDDQIRLTSLFGLGSTEPGSTALSQATSTGFSGAVLDPGDYSVIVTALESLSEGRSLTIPKVLVNNNEDAELMSVIQTPFQSTNASTTVATTSFGGTFDAGTQITVRPQIADGDRLILDYTVSISTFVGDSADPSLPPPRQENSLSSVATVPDGYTAVIGGLEVESDGASRSQVPFLGRLPLVGALFRSESISTSRTRFYVFLRCSVLREPMLADLRYLSDADLADAGLPGNWPDLEPRIIR